MYPPRDRFESCLAAFGRVMGEHLSRTVVAGFGSQPAGISEESSGLSCKLLEKIPGFLRSEPRFVSPLTLSGDPYQSVAKDKEEKGF